ncbi:hypothetical protein D3C80_1693010 [compost metagenome]
MAHGDQLIQVFFADRIKSIDTAVEWPDIGQIITYIVVQPLQPGQILHLLGIIQKAGQNAAERNGIINRPVMAFQQHFIFICKCVQTMVLHARKQQPRQLQRIQ